MSNPGALGRLRAALAEALAIYEGRQEDLAGESGRTTGTVCAVHEIEQYLSAVGIPDAELTPLSNLQGAFRDHARGQQNPLFAKTEKSSHRALSTDNAWHGTIAAAVTLLTRPDSSGRRLNKKTAIATVAKRIGVEAKKVKSWHHEISTEKQTDQAAIHIYKATLALAAEAHPDSPALAVAPLLAALPSVNLKL